MFRYGNKMFRYVSDGTTGVIVPETPDKDNPNYIGPPDPPPVISPPPPTISPAPKPKPKKEEEESNSDVVTMSQSHFDAIIKDRVSRAERSTLKTLGFEDGDMSNALVLIATLREQANELATVRETSNAAVREATIMRRFYNIDIVDIDDVLVYVNRHYETLPETDEDWNTLTETLRKEKAHYFAQTGTGVNLNGDEIKYGLGTENNNSRARVKVF